MASTTTPALLTFEEFENLPDEPGKCELLDGELIQLPPAILRHMQIARKLVNVLTPIVERHGPALGLGDVFFETGYKMGPRRWLQPDVSIPYANQASNDYFEGAPALAVEIISKSNSAEHI